MPPQTPGEFEVRLDAALSRCRRDLITAYEEESISPAWFQVGPSDSDCVDVPVLPSGASNGTRLEHNGSERQRLRVFGSDEGDSSVKNPLELAVQPPPLVPMQCPLRFETPMGSTQSKESRKSNESMRKESKGSAMSPDLTEAQNRRNSAGKYSWAAVLEDARTARPRPSMMSSASERLPKLGSLLVQGAPGAYAFPCCAGLHKVRCVRGMVFESVMGIVVILNAISVGTSLEVSPGSSSWLIIDAIFALIFGVELLVRLRGGIREFYCGKGRIWNIFETSLAVLAIFECVVEVISYDAEGTLEKQDARVVGMIRILRLSRTARVIRLLRLSVVSELMMLINGAIGGLRTLMWSYLLLMIPLYAVAMVLRQSLGEMPVDGSMGSRVAQESFSSLAASIFTSFRCLVANECTTTDGRPIFVIISEKYGGGYGILYSVTSVFFTFGLFNVIVAIYVENTVAAAKVNEVRQKQLRLTDQRMFKKRSLQLVELIWSKHESNVTGCSITEISQAAAMGLQISREMFESLRESKAFQDIIKDLDIADEEQLDLFETLDVDGGGTLDLEELVQGLAKLRGDARRSDVVSVSLMVRALMAEVMELKDTMSKQAASLQRRKTKKFPSLSSPSKQGDVVCSVQSGVLSQSTAHLSDVSNASLLSHSAGVYGQDVEKLPTALQMAKERVFSTMPDQLSEFDVFENQGEMDEVARREHGEDEETKIPDVWRAVPSMFDPSPLHDQSARPPRLIRPPLGGP